MNRYTAIEEQQHRMEATREKAHPGCVSCSPVNSAGLGLIFIVRADEGVEATFDCRSMYEGYPGLLHGGITSLLLDAAMTNCLFSRGKAAVTARLIVRFLLPVATGQAALVRAWVRENSAPLFVLEAELVQNGRVVASAAAKFIDREGL